MSRARASLSAIAANYFSPHLHISAETGKLVLVASENHAHTKSVNKNSRVAPMLWCFARDDHYKMPSLEAQARDIADRYQPPPIGTHSIITDTDAVSAFLKAIRDGNYLETAAKLSGISKSAIYEWLERADSGQEPYTRFADALKNAEAMAEAQDVANVRAAGKAGPQYWAASMTYLERRHPERWGKRQDESSGPKVIVQIGVKDSDVQIQMITVSPTPTTLSPPLSTDIHSLSAETATS